MVLFALLLLQEEPLSVDITIVPLSPTATNVLRPPANATALRSTEVGDVTAVHDEPLSVDRTILPLSPTATKILFPKVTP